jgi:hypothetical protein
VISYERRVARFDLLLFGREKSVYGLLRGDLRVGSVTPRIERTGVVAPPKRLRFLGSLALRASPERDPLSGRALIGVVKNKIVVSFFGMQLRVLPGGKGHTGNGKK